MKGEIHIYRVALLDVVILAATKGRRESRVLSISSMAPGHGVIPTVESRGIPAPGKHGRENDDGSWSRGTTKKAHHAITADAIALREADTSEQEAEIDALVYALYNLTEKEIAIVGGA